MRTSDRSPVCLSPTPSRPADGGISDRFPSLAPIVIFPSSLFYGHSLVRGAVVSGGDGVQRKVAEGNACTFVLHVAAPRSFLGCYPVCLKKKERKKKDGFL